MNNSLTVIPLESLFFEVPFAHRGFHDCDGNFGFGRPENSYAAFETAIDLGYGIEVDIQLSSDGIPMVFHDKNLKRILNIDKNLNEFSANDLQNLYLANREKIPTFDKFLELISGRVPILVEIKDANNLSDENTSPIADAVALSLERYHGPVAVMAFNPHQIKLFGYRLPWIPRGLVTEAFKEEDWPGVNREKLTRLRYLEGLSETAASFISHKHSDLNSGHLSQIPFTTKIFCWTIRNQEEKDLALKRADNITFEGFIP